MDGIILISKIEYFMLRQANEKLNRLERGGVKNWEFYGESLNPDGDNFDDEVNKNSFESTKLYRYYVFQKL